MSAARGTTRSSTAAPAASGDSCTACSGWRSPCSSSARPWSPPEVAGDDLDRPTVVVVGSVVVGLAIAALLAYTVVVIRDLRAQLEQLGALHRAHIADH